MPCCAKRTSDQEMENGSDKKTRKIQTTTDMENLSGDQSMLDVKSMINVMTLSLCALPFLKSSPMGIDDIEDKLEERKYQNKKQIFRDLTEVFKERNDKTFEIIIEIDNKERRHRITVTKKEMEKLGIEMTKRLTTLADTLSVEDQFRENPLAGKILTALKTRFPNVAEEKLKAEACKISTCNEGDWKQIVARICEENENNKPGAVYKRFRFFPSQRSEGGGEEAVHQHIAGLQFYKMLAKWSQPGAVIPVPLRKVANPQDAVASFDYVKNPLLEEAFDAQKEIFRKEGKETTEMFLFHGTAVANVDSILRENLSLELFSEEQGKERKRVFGEGIYFSEMPAVSLMYGNGLILCKVLLGNCQLFSPQPEAKQPEIPESFDSRAVIAMEGSSVIHVVKKPSQVLPYCVVHLKNEALSSEFHKPNHIPVHGPDGRDQEGITK